MSVLPLAANATQPAETPLLRLDGYPEPIADQHLHSNLTLETDPRICCFSDLLNDPTLILERRLDRHRHLGLLVLKETDRIDLEPQPIRAIVVEQQPKGREDRPDERPRHLRV